MKQIGFKNFRRFADFPAMDLAPITIFVGENNSGKSTVVKGILALSDFLNNWRTDYDLLIERNTDDEKKRKKIVKEKLANQKFYFNTSYLTHIGTFSRALYNKAETDTITFHTRIGLMDIDINVKGDKCDEESVCGTISNISVCYNDFGIQLDFDLFNDIAKAVFYPHPIGETNVSKLSVRKKGKIDDYYSSFDEPMEVETCISDNFRFFAPGLISLLVSSIENAINVTLFPKKARTDYFDMFSPIENLPQKTFDFLKMYVEKVPVNLGTGKRNAFVFPESRLMYNLFDIEYLYAHAVTQTVIYSAKDTNDYLSRTIHEYASLPSQEYKHEFITKWMKKFGIGIDYEIRSVGGEAHIVYIKNVDGKSVNLADKGMGSIQLMVLLFRLAISLPKNPTKGVRVLMYERIIIIEEPEQNLHPMLQSKLADLLYELYTEYDYHFIIETHSEYLIRKTQVIVKERYKGNRKSLKDNPFKVYYFNSSSSDKPYYEIVYQRDGSLENDFGKGFFDEASNLAFEIL